MQALLGSRSHTSLHEAALGAVAPHVAPGAPLPRAGTLALLYHLLGVVPAYRCACSPDDSGPYDNHSKKDLRCTARWRCCTTCWAWCPTTGAPVLPGSVVTLTPVCLIGDGFQISQSVQCLHVSCYER